jgi:hypothetical protein
MGCTPTTPTVPGFPPLPCSQCNYCMQANAEPSLLVDFFQLASVPRYQPPTWSQPHAASASTPIGVGIDI